MTLVKGTDSKAKTKSRAQKVEVLTSTARSELSRKRDLESGESVVRFHLRLKGEAADAFKELTNSEAPTDLIRRLLLRELKSKK